MWDRRGLIFRPDRQRDWIVSHACTPTALSAGADRLRILFAPRDDRGRSIPTRIDVDADDPAHVLEIGETPVMPLGELGTFDDGGIMPCSVIRNDGRLYLYYVGWNASVSVPYRNAIGLAISDDDGLTFHRSFPGAVVDRNRDEPFFTASPCVLLEDGLFRLWYASTIGFTTRSGAPEPVYILKYATSEDGIRWDRPNRTVIPQTHPEEAIARPSVIVEDGVYRMWFCYRGSRDFRDGADSYRLGYAESPDGIEWERQDHRAGLPRRADGFDARMEAYPNVLRHDGTLHMFYNGNGFGRDGIGHAVWQE